MTNGVTVRSDGVYLYVGSTPELTRAKLIRGGGENFAQFKMQQREFGRGHFVGAQEFLRVTFS